MSAKETVVVAAVMIYLAIMTGEALGALIDALVAW